MKKITQKKSNLNLLVESIAEGMNPSSPFDKYGFDSRAKTDVYRNMERFGDYDDDIDGSYYNAQLNKFLHFLEIFKSSAQMHIRGNGEIYLTIPSGVVSGSLKRVMDEYLHIVKAAEKAGWGVYTDADDIKKQYEDASKRERGEILVGLDNRSESEMNPKHQEEIARGMAQLGTKRMNENDAQYGIGDSRNETRTITLSYRDINDLAVICHSAFADTREERAEKFMNMFNSMLDSYRK